MAVELVGATILKPAPLPLPESNNNLVVPLTVFDRAAFNLHVPSLYAFLPPTPSNSTLKSGLSRILHHFPHLAGRIISDGHLRPCIALDNSGVRLLETNVSASLSEMLPLEDADNLDELHPAVGDGVEELLQIQLNRYSCVGSRPCLLQIFAELTCTVTNLKVHFSANFITELKSQVPGGCSTFEVLLAHLWRKISSARGLRATEETKVRVAVNGRARLNSLPNIPMEHYFGNLVLWAHPKLTVGDLIPAGGRGGLSAAVRIIHEAVGKIDDGYFRSFIDFGKLEEGKEGELVAAAPAPENVLYPNLEVDSWLRFRFHELDFGSGGPCAFMPPNLPVEGLMLFVPSMKETGGVDVFMALAAEHVQGFKKICYSLD
ncbi:Agmatine coumaroyltransferase-2 [Platanthera guangdongensis]|uniref:Agmatine coumaroyltransferase-2 n=1 Tax=Platanthera guangdongensis TaxID=2320717 RepID=A0ABR2N3Z7_9ASPA